MRYEEFVNLVFAIFFIALVGWAVVSINNSNSECSTEIKGNKK